MSAYIGRKKEEIAVKKKVIVWETLSTVSGGQKMTLTVMDLLKDSYEFFCLIPRKGNLSEELDKRNIPYALMGDQSMPNGVKGKQVIFRYVWLSAKNVIKSLKYILAIKPDVLYAPGPAALPWSALCGMLARKPVIWHLHHNFLDGATKRLLNLCSGWSAVKKIISVSQCVGEQITNAAAHGKLVVIYNPVDADKYANGNPTTINELIVNRLGNASWDRSKARIVIGHVGLIQRSKHQEFVLDVIADLRRQGYDAIGVFPGEIREMDYKDELEQKCKNLALQHSVMFLGRRTDIPDILRNLDVLIIPSTEGFPLAGLEAAAAGVPVVACNVAGAAEFIKESCAGRIYPVENIPEACDAIKVVLQNCDDFKSNGRSFARRCSYTAYKSSVIDVFNRAVKEE